MSNTVKLFEFIGVAVIFVTFNVTVHELIFVLGYFLIVFLRPVYRVRLWVP